MKKFLMEWNRDVLKFITNEMMGRVKDLTTWCMVMHATLDDDDTLYIEKNVILFQICQVDLNYWKDVHWAFNILMQYVLCRYIVWT